MPGSWWPPSSRSTCFLREDRAAVADRLVGLLESADADEGETRDNEIEQMTDELAELLDSVFLDSHPIARRFMDLLEARGWRGWTKLGRIGTAQI